MIITTPENSPIMREIRAAKAAATTFTAATQPQLDQIDQLRQQLTLPEEAVENQCYGDFGCCIDDLSFGEAERMIAMLSGWVREYGEAGR